MSLLLAENSPREGPGTNWLRKKRQQRASRKAQPKNPLRKIFSDQTPKNFSSWSRLTKKNTMQSKNRLKVGPKSTWITSSRSPRRATRLQAESRKKILITSKSCPQKTMGIAAGPSSHSTRITRPKKNLELRSESRSLLLSCLKILP